MGRLARALVWVVPLLAVAGGGYLYLRHRRAAASDPPKYDTAAVDKGRIIARITASGTLSPTKVVQVGSQVSGRISEINVDFNSEVKKDQVIARLDPQLLTAAVAQAKANLTGARADVQKAQALAKDAQRQAERSVSLAERKLVAQGDADTAVSAAEAAKAQVISSQGAVARAQASLDQEQLNLTYATIHSPIDGVVISRSVDVGQTVAASLQAPTLFTIAEDLHRMQIDTNVAEGDVGKLGKDTKVTFTVDAYPGKKFAGTIRQVRNAPQTIQNVVTYDAVIDVANPDLELKPGMTANVTFVYGQNDQALRVPNSALRFRAPAEWMKGAWGGGGGGAAGGRRGGPREEMPPDSKLVWRLEAGQPKPVRIKVGLSDGSTSEVTDGDLKEGDLLVTDAGGAGSTGQQTGGPPRRVGPL